MWARSGFAVVAAASMLTVGACGGGNGEQNKSAEDLPSPQREIRQTIDNFYRAQDGDLALYKSALCTKNIDELKDVSDRDFARTQREAVDKNGRFIVDWFDEIKVSDGTADVAFTGHSLGGPGADVGAQHETVNVVLQDGSWKICDLPKPDLATERKQAQLTDKAAVKDAIVPFANAMGAGELTLAEAAKPDQCRQRVLEFWAVYSGIDELTGSTVSSVNEITVNQDAAKAKFIMETDDISVPFGAALNREEGKWKVCIVNFIGQPTEKR
ncbi:MAG: hypothetical protein QOH60_2735 [Mycobacterium sp.]|jgi:hypothetical protein|nr:hypothetical protein [Mycobacterium sp.]